MLIESRGIVLRLVRYSDTAMIADVLTREAGRVSFVVHISRSGRSGVRHALFQPLAILDLSWEQRARLGVVKAKSAQVAMPLQSIQTDVRKATVALFLSEFLYYAVRTETAPGPIFEYIVASIEWLNAAERQYSNFHLVFLLHLARFLGFEPNMEDAASGRWFDLETATFTSLRPVHTHCIEPADAALLPRLMRMNYGTMHLFQFSGQERSRLLEHINTYYRLHLPSFPELRSLGVLREMFSATQ